MIAGGALGAQFGAPKVPSGLFYHQTSTVAHQQSSALWYLTCCLLHLSVRLPPQKHSPSVSTVPPQVPGACQSHGHAGSPSSLVPWAGREVGDSRPLLTLSISCSAIHLRGNLRERFLSSHRFSGGVSIFTLLALNFPRQLPTKALQQQCSFATACLEKTLGLRWWKRGPDFLQTAKPTVTQERQSSRWLHANLIVRLFNGFK